MIVFKHNPHDVCDISSPFGTRTDPLTGAKTMHNGIDIRPKARGIPGDPLYAVADGFVSVSKVNNGGPTVGLGYYVDIQHDGFRTRYAHLKELGLPAGAKVKPGQVVGYMGHTGRSTGVHLHFGVLAGTTWMDPAKYLIREEDNMTEDQVKKLIEDSRKVYRRASDLPEWAKPAIEKMIKNKIIYPDLDGTINLTHEMARLLVMIDRMVV